jgi:hypothetical protein
MSETLTMNETPADQPQFNADEQDSLQVAESLEGGEQPLLAGKFKDSGELEKAYLELQTKLGEPRGEVQTTEDEGEPAEQEQEQEEVSEESEAEVLSEEQANQLMDMVGGEKAYQSMLQWASKNLSKEEIQMYDSVMGKGEPNAIFFAVQALNSKYSDAVGSDGQMLTGRDGSSDSQGFRSQAELVAAMNDPRYDRDPAYRRDVMSRLENSDVQF